MKYSFLPLLTIVALCGCNTQKSDYKSPDNTINITLSGGVTNDKDVTKGSYQPNDDNKAYNFYWAKGDQASLYLLDSEDNENRPFITNELSKIAIFEGQVTPWVGEKELAVIAPYRSNGYTLTNDNSIIYDLSSQSITPSNVGDFGDGLLMTLVDGATAESEDNYDIPFLEFKQALSTYQIDLSGIPSGEKVTEVGLECSDESLLFSAEIDLATGEVVEGSHRNMTTDCIKATVSYEEVSTEVILNLKLLPADLSDKTVTLYVVTNNGTGDKRYIRNFMSGIELKRNSFIANAKGALDLSSDFTTPPVTLTISEAIENAPSSNYWIITDSTIDEAAMGSFQQSLQTLNIESLTLDFTELTELPNGAFYGVDVLKSIILHKVESIPDSAFRLCRNLESVSAESATTVVEGAFYECSKLTEVSLPSATTLNCISFAKCTSLQSISLPKATSIYFNTFQQCPALNSLEIATDASATLSLLQGNIFSDLDDQNSSENIELTIGAHNNELVNGSTLSCDDGNQTINSYTFKKIILTSDKGGVGVVEDGEYLLWE